MITLAQWKHLAERMAGPLIADIVEDDGRKFTEYLERADILRLIAVIEAADGIVEFGLLPELEAEYEKRRAALE